MIDELVTKEFGNKFYCCNPDDLKVNRGANFKNDGVSWSVYVHSEEHYIYDLYFYSYRTMTELVNGKKLVILDKKDYAKELI